MSKAINIGSLLIGGGNDVIIQSMINVRSDSYDEVLTQTNRLYENGCKIVRVAIGCDDDINACKEVIKNTAATMVADIQFDYKLAVKASDAGFQKIRINPGNIGGEDKIKEIVRACLYNKTVIRVGSNSGSIDKEVYREHNDVAKALCFSALKNVRLLEKYGFTQIVISAKASNVSQMIKANRMLASLTDYPLHLGVTESGSRESGIIKSSIGVGSLLNDNIGDTIRISLSCDPLEEVKAARQILRAVGRDKSYCEVVSCPTCARCNYNLQEIVEWVEEYTRDILIPIKMAIMGCAVNGPGEARDADFGVAGGRDGAVIFEKGRVIETIPFEEIKPKIKAFLAKNYKIAIK